MGLLGDAAESFRKNCVVGIEANHVHIEKLMNQVYMLKCSLAPSFIAGILNVYVLHGFQGMER